MLYLNNMFIPDGFAPITKAKSLGKQVYDMLKWTQNKTLIRLCGYTYDLQESNHYETKYQIKQSFVFIKDVGWNSVCISKSTPKVLVDGNLRVSQESWYTVIEH